MNNILVLNHPLILKPLKWSFFLRIFWILNILLISALLVFYIFQVNTEVTGKYLIQKYGRQISEISKENKNLEIQTVQVSSLYNISELLEPFNFQKINKIYYIQVLDTQVVAK